MPQADSKATKRQQGSENSRAEPPEPPGLSGPSGPSGFGRLARRISAWTTNGVLSAMVLVVAVLFGRQVLEWWRADTGASSVGLLDSSTADGLAGPGTRHFFGFGNSAWRLARQSMAGSRQEATVALRAACLEVLPTSAAPPGEPGAAEQQFLDSVADQPPVAGASGRWRLYELDGPFPMAAGTLLPGGLEASGQRKQVARAGPRVVTWGIAVPVTEGEWTLYAFHSPAPSSGPFPDLPEVPLPPDSTRALSMRVAGGGRVIAFKGASQAERWRRFFDRWFQGQGWAAAGDWRAAAGGWHHRYTGAHGATAGSVDVRLGPDGRGGMTGLLMINPPATTSSEGEGSCEGESSCEGEGSCEGESS